MMKTILFQFIVLFLMQSMSGIHAAVILNHQGSTNPTTEGFYYGANSVNGASPTVGPVTGDLGNDAWQINTMAQQDLYAWYQNDSTMAAQASSLNTNGWKLTVKARVVQTYQPGSGNGGAFLSLFIVNARYNLGLNLNSTSSPTSTQVWTNSGTVYNLSGGSLYHTYVLLCPALSANPNRYASLYIDGNLVESNIKTVSSGSTLYFGDCSGSSGQVTNTYWSQVQLESPPPASLTGTITPGDYVGDKQDLAVKIDFRQNGASVLTSRFMLNSDGTFTVSNVPSGVYDLYFAVGGWLQKVLANQSVVNSPTNVGMVTLLNGDGDGDQAVTSTDLSAVLANMDQAGKP